MTNRSRCMAALLAVVGLLLVAAAPASAGRLLVTGHDADLHCSSGSQCHFVRVAVEYVRGGAPDPNKPVLVLDRGALQLVSALDAAFAPAQVPRVVIDPRSPQFASEPLNTNSYSAILVASDTTCGGCDLNDFDATPDSDAINARKDDISAFFNSGGGIYANSGGRRGDGDPVEPDVYYDFLPIPAGGQPVTGPFCLTPIGTFIGFQDTGCPDASRHAGTNDDINCCATHNSFEFPPSGSALEVAEIDVAADGVISADDVPETLVGEGTASGGEIVSGPPPTFGETATASVVKGEVSIKLPEKGADFVPLTDARSIPFRSIVDTTRGTVELRTARSKTGKVQSGRFAAGVFQVLQSRKRKEKGLTSLNLKGSAAAFSSCPSGRAGANTAGRRRRKIRRLRGSARGRYRTRGRHSAATVRGTIWTITDRCDGTLTTVERGTVAVRDFRLKKTIILKRGKRYLARAPGA